MTRVQVYLDPKHIQLLDLMAIRSGSTRSHALRRSIEIAGKKVRPAKNPLLQMAGAAGNIPSQKNLSENVDEIYSSKYGP